MTNPKLRRTLSAFLVAALAAHVGWSADTARPKGTTSTKASGGARAGGATSGRGALPDPNLLDGSSHPAEKKSEYGMIGDFELPGDENARNQRVGGSSQPPPPGAQQQEGQGGGGVPTPAGGSEQQQGGGGSDQQIAQQQQGGGQSGQSQSGAQAGGSQGQAGGIQVGQLQGEGGAQPAPGLGEKPPAVSIGDTAMRIPSNASNPNVVGGQQIANQNTQHHDKVGTGGKGPSSPQGPNRVEKGRTIPAGL